MKKLIIFIIASLLFAAVASADCMYNGKSYPTRIVINGKVCQADGSWD